MREYCIVEEPVCSVCWRVAVTVAVAVVVSSDLVVVSTSVCRAAGSPALPLSLVYRRQ